MVMRVDKTGRDDQSGRIDHARTGRNLDLVAFAGRDNRVVLQKNNRIRHHTTT